MQVKGLRSLVDLAVTTSTEICQPKMLPHMTMGGQGVLIHDPTVRAESNLLSQMSVQGDRYSVQNSALWTWVIMNSLLKSNSTLGRTTAIRGLDFSLLSTCSRLIHAREHQPRCTRATILDKGSP